MIHSSLDHSSPSLSRQRIRTRKWRASLPLTISAAVAKDRAIFWRDQCKTRNGQRAAEIYHELKEALANARGHKRRLVIVEDGALKGRQVGKNIAANVRAGIQGSAGIRGVPRGAAGEPGFPWAPAKDPRGPRGAQLIL